MTLQSAKKLTVCDIQAILAGCDPDAPVDVNLPGWLEMLAEDLGMVETRPGSGKGVSIVIPDLLQWNGSTFDIMGENFNKPGSSTPISTEDKSMSEEQPNYLPEQLLIGNMPLPEVYAALDFVLAVGRSSEAPDASVAGRRLLLTWLRGGALPSKEQIEQTKTTMAQQIDVLAAAFADTLRTFVADLDSHLAPLPGSPYGDYFHDLVSLSAEDPPFV